MGIAKIQFPDNTEKNIFKQKKVEEEYKSIRKWTI